MDELPKSISSVVVQSLTFPSAISAFRRLLTPGVIDFTVVLLSSHAVIYLCSVLFWTKISISELTLFLTSHFQCGLTYIYVSTQQKQFPCWETAFTYPKRSPLQQIRVFGTTVKGFFWKGEYVNHFCKRSGHLRGESYWPLSRLQWPSYTTVLNSQFKNHEDVIKNPRIICKVDLRHNELPSPAAIRTDTESATVLIDRSAPDPGRYVWK